VLRYLDLRGRKWREAGEDCIMRSFIKLYASPYVIRVKKDEMGETCIRHGRHEKYIQHVYRKT